MNEGSHEVFDLTRDPSPECDGPKTIAVLDHRRKTKPLFDTGSQANACPPGHGGGKVKPSKHVALASASGAPIHHYGSTTVTYDAGDVLAEVEYDVADVTRPIMAAVKAMKAKKRVVLDLYDPEGSYILDKTTGNRIPIILDDDGSLVLDMEPTTATSSTMEPKWCMPVHAEIAVEANDEIMNGMEEEFMQELGRDEGEVQYEGEAAEDIGEDILGPLKGQPDHVASQLRIPREPSAEEVRQHSVTHVPFADWCEVCVKGKAAADPHRQLQLEERAHPILGAPVVLQWDYSFAKTGDANRQLTILNAWDTGGTGTGRSIVVENKGLKSNNNSDFAVRWGVSFCKSLPYSEVILQHDGEHSIAAYLEAVSDKVPHSKCRSTPLHSSESNGGVERFSRSNMDQTRTLRLSLQQALGDIEITSDDDICYWMVRHSSYLLERFQPYLHGPTPFCRRTGSDYRGALVNFAETALALNPDQQASGGVLLRRKLKERWVIGIWLGKDETTDEHYVAVENVVRKYRSVRRMPGIQFNQQAIKELTAVPQQTDGRKRPVKGRPSASLDDLEGEVDAKRLPGWSRTPGCSGCEKVVGY